MNEIKFARIQNQFADCKYFLGDFSGRKGWDCLSMIHALYTSVFPDEYKGFNASNYAERWNRGEGRKEFREFLLSLGRSVEFSFMRKGDLIIFENEHGVSPGIYEGNDTVCIITEKGGRKLPLKKFLSFANSKIISIRRVID